MSSEYAKAAVEETVANNAAPADVLWEVAHALVTDCVPRDLSPVIDALPAGVWQRAETTDTVTEVEQLEAAVRLLADQARAARVREQRLALLLADWALAPGSMYQDCARALTVAVNAMHPHQVETGLVEQLRDWAATAAEDLAAGVVPDATTAEPAPGVHRHRVPLGSYQVCDGHVTPLVGQSIVVQRPDGSLRTKATVTSDPALGRGVPDVLRYEITTPDGAKFYVPLEWDWWLVQDVPDF